MEKLNVENTENRDNEKLLHINNKFTFAARSVKRMCNNSRRVKHHTAPPHIQARKVKGKTYYYFKHGRDDPIFLGSAESILKAVTYSKIARSGNGDSFETDYMENS